MNVSKHVRRSVSVREQERVCNVGRVRPQITLQEGSRTVGGLEIEWRYQVTAGADGEVDWTDATASVQGLNPSAPSIRVPKKFETTIIDLAHGRGYWLVIEIDSDGLPTVVGFTVDTIEGSEGFRTYNDFKRIPFRRLLDESVAAVALPVATRLGEGWLVFKAGGLARKDVEAARRPRGGRGVPIDNERLALVADLHRCATEAGDATSKYIAREMKVTAANARQLIHQARRKGFIPPAGETY